MLERMLKVMICVALMAALTLPCAVAESPSDDVSGYNPFDTNADAGATNDAEAVAPAATPLTMADPFISDGTASMGEAFAPTPTPLPTVANGVNPFDVTAPAGPVPTSAVMYVVTSTAKVTNKAAVKAGTQATLSFGDQVAVSAIQGDWAQVQTAKGLKGYVTVASLAEADPNTLNQLMYVQLNQVAMHRTPNTKSGRYRTLKKGDTVTMVAVTVDGLWARVTDGTNYGFIPTIYLDDAPSAEGTVVWCGVGSTDIMVNPNAWVRISGLSFGQQVRLVGYVADNTIAKIRNDKGYVAYCDVAALTTSDPATLSTPVYAQATGRVLSNGTAEDANHYNVNKGAALTLLGVDPSGNWALVKQGKRKLYIPFIFLGNERIGKNYKVVVSNQDAPLYQSAQSGAAILGTLPMGTRLNLLGGEGNSAKVSTISDGVTQTVVGYLDMRYLYSETQVNTAVVNDVSDIASGFFQ